MGIHSCAHALFANCCVVGLLKIYFRYFEFKSTSVHPVFSEVRVTRSLVFMCTCRSLFVLLYFLFWPLCCLFFFDIRNRITPLVSSNSSYYTIIQYYFKINPLWLLRTIRIYNINDVCFVFTSSWL
jgi:hypothetical protein